jgi:hypothetical protein
MTVPSLSSSARSRRLARSFASAAWVPAAALAVIAPLLRTWLSGDTFVVRDTLQLYAPVRGLVGEALRAGRLPLWNPFVATGMPLLAETVHGVLHPISVLGAFLFPDDRLDPLIVAHLAAAGTGAAVLARTIGASRPAAVGAAIAYGLGGFTLSMTGNFVFLAGASSLPWLVAGIVAAARAPAPPRLTAAAAAVAIAAFSGDVQATLVGIALGGALACAEAGWRALARAAAAVAIGALLAAIQLLPSWCHLGRTDRGTGVPADAWEWSFAPWRVIELVSPGFFVDPAAGYDAPVYVALGAPGHLLTPLALSAFVGAAAIALAATGVRARRAGLILAIAAALLLWLATGDHAGADRLLSVVPVVRGLRYTEKYLGPFTLCVSVLAALGLDRVAADARAARRLAVLSAGAAVVGAAACVAVTEAPEALFGVAGARPEIALHLARGLPHAIAGALGLAACALLFSRGLRRLGMAATLATLWGSSAAAAPYALRPGPAHARVDVPAPAITADPPGPRLLHLRAMPSRPRPPGLGPLDQTAFDNAAIALPNLNVRHRLDALGVDTGLRPTRYEALQQALGTAWLTAARRYGATHAVFPTPQREQSRAIVAAAVRDARPLPREPRTGAEVWSLPHRPWASFGAGAIVASGPAAAVAEVRRLEETGGVEVVVESASAVGAARGRILSLSRRNEDLSVEAEADGDALLVVRDAFWPGWRATIDGREVPIFAADALVRAVPFPPGRHVLEMRYDPPEVRMGAWITLAGAALLLAHAWRAHARGRRRS